MWATGKKVAGGGAPTVYTSRWYVSSSTNQDIPFEAWTLIEFDDVDYDNDSEYDNVTNFDIEIAASGMYHLGTEFQIKTLADGEAPQVAIRVNGTIVLHDRLKVGGTGVSGVHAEGDVELTAGDLVTVEGYRNVGAGNKDAHIDTGCCFFGHRIA